MQLTFLRRVSILHRLGIGVCGIYLFALATLAISTGHTKVDWGITIFIYLVGSALIYAIILIPTLLDLRKQKSSGYIDLLFIISL